MLNASPVFLWSLMFQNCLSSTTKEEFIKIVKIIIQATHFSFVKYSATPIILHEVLISTWETIIQALRKKAAILQWYLAESDTKRTEQSTKTKIKTYWVAIRNNSKNLALHFYLKYNLG